MLLAAPSLVSAYNKRDKLKSKYEHHFFASRDR